MQMPNQIKRNLGESRVRAKMADQPRCHSEDDEEEREREREREREDKIVEQDEAKV
jgi:hypothetical protein